MTSARTQLASLLARKSFRLGQFKLASGGSSDYYVDCRTTTLDATGSRLTGQAVLDEIRSRGWQVDAIGGLTMGADPIAVSAAVLSEGRLNAFLVRKTEKAHGTGKRIEGFCQPGAHVVIVDDVCTTGGSTIQAIEAARAAGFQVAGVICLVEREEAGGRTSVEEAAGGAPFVSLFSSNDIRREYLKQQQEGAANARD
jgi:orotate phosphoribosyltransferase